MKAAIRDKSNNLPSVFELIIPSFSAININIFLYLGLLLLPGLLSSVLFSQESTATIDSLSDLQNYKFPIEVVVSQVVSFALVPFLLFVQLHSARGNKVTLKKTLTKVLPKYFKLLGLVIFVYVLTFLGLLIFILPGLVVLKRFILSPYYLLDENVSIMTAMKRSRKDVSAFSKSVWAIIGFGVLVIIIAIITSVAPYLVLLLAAGQLSLSMMPALRYHQIKEQLGWTFDFKAHPPIKS